MNVAVWLRDLGLGPYEQAFRANDIDADLLPMLTDEDLRALGVASLGHRKRLLAAIATLAGSGGPQPSPTPQAERRQLTVMFVDLVGSTALSSRLGPEDMREVLHAYQNTVTGQVARIEGHVAKLMGDGVAGPAHQPFHGTSSPTQAVNNSHEAQKGAISPLYGGHGPGIWELPGQSPSPETPQETLMRTMMAAALCALAMAANAHAAIKEEPVTYQDGETTMKGFVVYDDAVQGKRPGIVMVHEWWGITKHIHNEAQKFAQQGYTAFIADMYGDAKTADNPKDAGALSGSVMKDPKVMEARFNAAQTQLARHPSVDPTRVGAVGYCFGGAVVLNMARAGTDLTAVTGFHASLGLNTPAPGPGTVKAKILVLNGADDPFVKREQYEVFKKDLDAAKADYRVIEYPGAVHAFTNPEATELGRKFNLPLRYDAQVDREAKAEASKFFAANLQK